MRLADIEGNILLLENIEESIPVQCYFKSTNELLKNNNVLEEIVYLTENL